MACFLLHTSHILSNIYNSAKFPDQSKHSQTIGKTTLSHFWTYTVENENGNNSLSTCWHWKFTCLYSLINMRGLDQLVFGVTSAVLTALLREWRKCTVARWLEWKKSRKRALYPHGSTGRRHRFYCHLLRSQGGISLRRQANLQNIRSTAAPPKRVSTRGGLMRRWNECAIVVTVCTLVDTTDWDMTSTSFTKRRRL